MSKHVTIAEALDEAGRHLQPQYGDEAIPVAELRKLAAKIGGHQESGILPSDFCYNRTNAGVGFAANPMLLYMGRGEYRYVGTGYPYTGPVLHKPYGEAERQVGRWENGILILDTSAGQKGRIDQ